MRDGHSEMFYMKARMQSGVLLRERVYLGFEDKTIRAYKTQEGPEFMYKVSTIRLAEVPNEMVVVGNTSMILALCGLDS